MSDKDRDFMVCAPVLGVEETQRLRDAIIQSTFRGLAMHLPAEVTFAKPDGPFTAYGFTTNRSDAHVELNGEHFMTVNTLHGAERLAAILNEALALAGVAGAIGNEERWSRSKIAFAVAKALGHKIEFQQAEPA